MDIGVVGAGSLGSLFGGYLHDSGQNVHLVDKWEDQINAIRDRGLVIRTIDGNEIRVHPQASTEPDAVGEVDVAFIFTKSQDTEQAVRDAEPMIGERTSVVTLQNGIDNMHTIATFIEDDRVFAGWGHEGATLVEPGRVLHTADAGTSKIGPFGDGAEMAERIAQMLTDAKIETVAVDDPRPYVWEKQLYSCAAKPIQGLTGLVRGDHNDCEPAMHASEVLLTEALEVARAKDIDIPRDDPLEHFREMQRGDEETKSSMLEDIENKRETEIEFMNGAIVRHGEEIGVETPYNELATALVKGREYAYLEAKYSW